MSANIRKVLGRAGVVGRRASGGYLPSGKARDRSRNRSRLAVEALEPKTLLTYASPLQGFLTGPQAGAPLDIAEKYLSSHMGDYGMSGDDLSRAFVTDDYTDSSMGVTHIYFRQGFNGVPISGADVNVNIGPQGQVISIGGQFVSGLGTQPSAAAPPAPALTADKALISAARRLGVPGPYSTSIVSGPVGSGQVTQITAPGISQSTVNAQLDYVINADGSLSLTWQVPFDSTASDDYWDPFVDANSGKLLVTDDWTDHYEATYNVQSLDNRVRSPDDGPRTIVVSPWDSVASPIGWQADTGNGTSATYTITRGNNVYAYEDHAGNDQPGVSPDGGSSLKFDFPVDLTKDPTTYTAAATVNAFYWANIVHDVWYHYGFTEAAGNFQENNFGLGGAGGDPVHAQAQDGSGTDNANFSTPPDGSPGTMRMFVFDLTTPNRDGDFDPEIMTHEMGHGLSNRLTGGPSNSSALVDIQSGGMGEGWSDFWSLSFLVHPGDTENTPRPTGTYVLGQPTSGVGVRHFPYSYDMSVNPLTIGDYNNNLGDGGNPEVHNTGEIWCETLWDMYWNLVNKDGYDPNLYTGTGGNNLAIKLIIEGMMLQPANPTFKDARDAILRADQVLNNGQDQFEIWSAFARRGMGLSFDAGADANSTTVTPATDMPKFLQMTVTTGITEKELTAFNDTQVATLTDPSGVGDPTLYAATIDWGDGQVTTAQIVPLAPGDKQDYKVLGTHTYATGGDFPIKITAVKVDGSDSRTATGSISVTGLPINAVGTTYTLNEGDTYGAPNALATFTDSANSLLGSSAQRSPSFYKVTIDYGDGSTAIGTVASDGKGGYAIYDTTGHEYGGGTDQITITIEKPGLSAVATSTAIVKDSPLHAAGFDDVALTEGTVYTLPFATFTDEDPRQPGVDNYFATIDWGDGTVTNGTIVPNPAGPGFAVSGDHPYNIGSYPIVVTVGNHSGGNTAIALTTVNVADAPLFSNAFNLQSTAGQTVSGLLARLTDADPRVNPTSHYVATIDWGDGTKTTGTVVVNEDGGYLVKGSHTYRAGVFTATTSVTDVGGSTTTTSGVVTVSDAPVTITALPNVKIGQGTSQIVSLASFSTPNVLALPSDYTATIDFGDGTIGNGNIIANGIIPASAGSPGQANFLVVTDKIYDAPGQYPFGVVLNSPGGSQLQATGSLTVTAAPVSVSGAPFTAASKTNLTGQTVATFVSANPRALASDYSATINWGDGTLSVGTIVPLDAGGFAVQGGHTYREGGTYATTTTVVGTGGISASAGSVATISDRLTPITGGAVSTTGTISPTGTTNSSTPIFRGTAEPGANIQIFAATPNGSAQLIGRGQADATGSYSIAGSTLPDGQYTITASATDSAGKPSSDTTVLYPTASRGYLTVDTQGPRVAAVSLNPRSARVVVQISDGLSGIGAGTLHASNFTLRSTKGKAFAVTGLTVSPVAPLTQQTATLTFNGGRPLPKGTYILSLNAAGLSDLAGNPLDERYFVPFPALYNQPGQNFVAAFQTNGTTSSAPLQFIPPSEVAAARIHNLFVRKHFRRG